MEKCNLRKTNKKKKQEWQRCVFFLKGLGSMTSITVDFGDGTAISYVNISSIDDGVKHIYSRVGIYQVSATATNTLGFDRVILYLHVSCEFNYLAVVPLLLHWFWMWKQALFPQENRLCLQSFYAFTQVNSFNFRLLKLKYMQNVLWEFWVSFSRVVSFEREEQLCSVLIQAVI